MTPGIATAPAQAPAQPDILSVLVLFVAIVLFGLLVVGGIWVLAKLSEKMGWSKRRRRRAHIPRGARTRAPSKAVSFARQAERLDQLQVAPRALPMVGDPQIRDMLQSWAVARGAPDLRVIAHVDLAALFAVTSTGDAGRAATEVLRGHKVDYVLAEPGGMPVAGLMQTDAEDIHTATLLRETVLRELFRKGALPLVELPPEATSVEVHRSLDAAFDLLPDAEQTEQSAPQASPMPQAVPDAVAPQIAEAPGFAPMQRPTGPRVEAPLPPMPRPGRRRRGER
ncbi:hypothetical protein [Dinoroseobacter sp. S76]|uniref:hypothetical protein n=1 Tax=Dinoroseobacter sp. S76 TaxID=3415124 RepID=UPI003C798DC0